MRKLLISLLVIFNCLPKAAMVKYKDKSEDGVLLNAVITADLHTDGDPTRDRNNLIRRELTGLSQYCGKTDAFVLAGDITNCGDAKEYRHIKAMLRSYTASGQYVPSMGNHDSWNQSEDPDFETASKLFQKFCKFCKIKTDKNYYSLSVNGFRFICLGTEELSHNQATLSDEQLLWLDSQLCEEEGKNKPVFIICHQTLAGHNGTGDVSDGGSIGEQSSEVEAILEGHAEKGMKILFVSGHMHEIGENTFEQDGSIYYLNLPSFQYDNGIGFTVNVYSDKMIVQGVNFLDGEAMSDYIYTIEL